MQTHTTIVRTRATTRTAMAPLEFVMALPVLLLLMVAITWLGFSVIGQTEVLVQARNKTWQRRFENASDKPLYFPILKGLYNEKADYVSEKATQRVDVSPMFSRLPGPEAGHTILAGSWDHRAMKFDKPPDLKLMAVAAAIGTFGNALDAGASLDDPLGLLKEVGDFSSAGKKSKDDADSAGKSVGEGGEDSGTGGGTGAPGDPQTPKEGEAKTKEDQRKKKEELIKKRQKLGGQIIITLQGEQVIAVGGDMKAVQDEIDRLERERGNLLPQLKVVTDEKKKKELQDEYDRLSRQIELQDIKYDRLKAEFLDVDAELKALD